jgi:hypothetical protein
MVLVDSVVNDVAHLSSEKIHEMHSFAKAIGLNENQFCNKQGAPHYVINGEQTQKAIQSGAKQVNRKAFVNFLKMNSYDQTQEESKDNNITRAFWNRQVNVRK